MTEYRASFDADVTFSNGGGLQVQGFRLDLPGPQPASEELAGLFVSHLGLLMVDQVRLSNIEVFAEAHKGSRGGPAATGATASESRRLVDLSHPIEAGMTTYPGLPGPEISRFVSRADSRQRYAEGTEFAIDRITMVGNTGTYVDSPYHRYEGGVDLAGLPLTSLADLPIVVVRLTGSRERGVTAQTLAPYPVSGAAVLLHTGWDRHWRTDTYGSAAPFLTEDGARFLTDAGARLVGIDSVNIDSTDGGERPAHSILLGAGIPVLEHLTNLGELPVHGARLHAVPAPVRDFGTFPVRAYALI
ncbi:cyclase family protein [Natronosporangium hydrolyticum]|uniref:Cyclase family protein n=1 Tax=Natronosporangium hydrolyticum TaxID=2811111 RepID=A0A895YMW1_9ACTN|nr:cyclase family protein [Natronosporangium hydrolyticum]QSB16643.1 cyclase family protein [Natronosporangium hydrolyticum]